MSLGLPCDPSSAEPLHIVAHLAEGIVLRHSPMLDALLAWAESSREQSLPPLPGEPIPDIEIPVLREPAGRFHLCSQGFAKSETFEVRHKHRRAPWQEMARLGTSKITRVDITVGANKSYRVPYEYQHVADNRIEWWCVGDLERIRELLSMVRYLGKHRGSGKGRLDIHRQTWTVEPCEPWGEGFPVLRDRLPMRPLPLDYPGLADDSPQGFRRLTFPYWDHTSEELVACPF